MCRGFKLGVLRADRTAASFCGSLPAASAFGPRQPNVAECRFHQSVPKRLYSNLHSGYLLLAGNGTRQRSTAGAAESNFSMSSNCPSASQPADASEPELSASRAAESRPAKRNRITVACTICRQKKSRVSCAWLIRTAVDSFLAVTWHFWRIQHSFITTSELQAYQ
jgi:hypothetical protein